MGEQKILEKGVRQKAAGVITKPDCLLEISNTENGKAEY